MISKPSSFYLFLIGTIVAMVVVFPFPQRLMMMYFSFGRLDQALDQAHLVINTEGENSEVLRYLADIADSTGDPEGIIAYCKRLVEMRPDDPQIYQRLADAYIWTGQPILAAHTLEQKLDVDPDDLNTLWVLADLYIRLDRLPDAVRIEEQLLDLVSDPSQVAAGLAYNYSLLDRPQKEVLLRRRIVDWKPDDRANLERLAELFVNLKRVYEGLAFFSERLKRAPSNIGLARVTLYMALETGDSEAYQQVEPILTAAFGGRGALIREVITRSKAGGNLALAVKVLKNYTAAFAPGIESQIQTAPAGSADDAEVELFMQLARLQLENNNVPGAYETLLTLVRRRPDAREAWKQLYTVAAWTGRPDKIKDAVTLRLKQNPNDPDALTREARLLMDAGDYDRAKTILTALVKEKPDSPELWRLVMRMYLIQGDDEQARRAYDQLARLGDIKPEETRFEELSLAISPDSAINLGELRRIAQESPENSEAMQHYLRVAAYALLSPLDVAFLNGVVSDTEDAELLDRIGRVFLAGSRVREAITCYEKILGLNPNNIAAAKRLTELYAWTGRLREGLKIQMHLFSQSPDDPEVRRELARLAWQLNEWTLAKVHYEWLYENGFLEGDDLLNLAEILIDQGGTDRVLTICRDLLTDPRAVPLDQVRAAQLALRLKSLALAESLVRLALDRSPDSTAALKTLARIQADNGKYQEAVDSLQRAVRLRASDYETHFMLGEMYTSLGRKELAQQAYDQADALIQAQQKGKP